MLIRLSKKDAHTCSLMGADTVKLCEMQGFKPRLDNKNQSRVEANIYGFKAEFAIARLFNLELPTINVASDGGVDLWFDDYSIDVKFNNLEYGKLIFDNLEKFKSQIAVLVGKTKDPNVMRVNGWISKKNFETKSYENNFGYGDRLVMNHNDLEPIETLWYKLMEFKFK
jgi:hypothetical protein|tara:strand:+ start:1180 stop:1686 length:507 start_codon:yes stop_codon:yes gene_type:complete